MKQAAIIGFGGMGKWHQDAISQQIKELTVTGILDVRPEAKAEAREKNLHVYQDLESLLADQAIEVVIVATPNDSHKEYIIKALRAGKHVVSEKPVVLKSTDLTEIIAEAKEATGLFTIHQNRRWDHDFQIVKEVLNQSDIGKPYFIESRVNGSSIFLHGWRDYEINGGGMLYDWGVHLIDQALQLIPEKVVSVHAHLFNIHSKEVDDNIKVSLMFENEVSVILEVATNCFIPAPRWHVSCKNGTFLIENWACEGKIVQLADNQAMKWENDIVYTAAGPTRTMAPRPDSTVQEKALPTIKDARGNEYHRFSSADIFYHNLLEAIEGKQDLLVKAEEALRVIQIIELAFQSAKEQQGIACAI